MEQRGRKNRDGLSGGIRVFNGRDEVETARIFDKGKVNYQRFLDDEAVVNDERLVIRWGGTR
jgi:phosphatidate phosphatase LPIN